MAFQGSKGQDGVLSSLDMAIDALIRPEATGITPIKAAFTSASVLLSMIRARFFLSMLIDCWLMYILG